MIQPQAKCEAAKEDNYQKATDRKLAVSVWHSEDTIGSKEDFVLSFNPSFVTFGRE